MKTEWTIDEDLHKNNHYQILDGDGFRVAWVANQKDLKIIASAPETARERDELKQTLYQTDQHYESLKSLNAELLEALERCEKVMRELAYKAGLLEDEVLDGDEFIKLRELITKAKG